MITGNALRLWNGTAWVDLHSRIKGEVVIKQGRGTELDEIAAGTMNFVLTNQDGALTPGNPSSPYAAWLKEDCRVTYLVLVNGVECRRFYGRIKSIAPSFPEGRVQEGTVAFSCLDALGQAGTFRPRHPWACGVRRAAHYANCRWDYFDFAGDGDAAASFPNQTDSPGVPATSVVNTNANRRGPLSFTSADGLTMPSAVQFNPDDQGNGSTITVLSNGNNVAALMVFIKFPTGTQPTGDVLTFRDSVDGVQGFVRLVNNNGAMELRTYSQNLTFPAKIGDNVATGNWGLLFLRWDSNNTAASRATWHTTFSKSFAYYSVTLDMRFIRKIQIGGSGGDVPKMEAAGLALWNDMDAAATVNHAYSSQGPGGIDMALTEWAWGGVHAAPLGGAVKDSIVNGRWGEMTALEVLQRLAKSGRGVVWHPPDKTGLHYLARDVCYPNAPLVTIDCELDMLAGLELDLSSDQRPTRAEVTYPMGRETRVDAAREAANNNIPRAVQAETFNGNAWGAGEVANFMITRSGDGPRIKSLTVDLDTSPNNPAATLLQNVNPPGQGLFPTQRIRLLVPPSHFGVGHLDMHVQGWEERYSEAGSTITLDTSPAFEISDTAPPPPVTETLYPSKEIAVYKMMYSTSTPALGSIQSGFNVLRMAFMFEPTAGATPVLCGWSAQGKTSFISDSTTFRNNGGRVVVSIGGSGNAVTTADRRTEWINAIKALRDEMGFLDGIDWDIEGSNPIVADDIVAISSALKSEYGAEFGITFAPNGSNVNQYLAAAKACQDAGCLTSYGQQFYDAPVTYNDAKWRVTEALNYGLAVEKISIGMLVSSDPAIGWTNAQCQANMQQFKADFPGLNRAYLWEASRTGTAQWITDMKTVIG